MAPPKSADTASGPRPYSFPGVSTTSDSSDAQHLQRPITSRFVEGSMNDRSSRAPPVSFLNGATPADPADSHASQPSQEEQQGFGYNFTRRSLQMARPSFSSFRGGSSANSSTAPSGTTTTSNTSSSISTTNTTSTTATTSTTTSSGTLRRPRSFLAPFWEGVTKRLHRRARSTLESDLARAEEPCDTKMEDEALQSPQPTGLPQVSDRPSPDEVFANYQKLMQAGFFTKRAIPATRPGLSGDHSIAVVATTPVNTPAPSCPDRFPPPPPRPAFLSSGTPLSPVAPSPAPSSASTPMTTTPRGTKRIRADVDNNNQEAKDSAFKIVSIIAASDAPLSSPTRTPRKISKKLRKSSSRLPGGESLRSVAANESASNSRPSTAQSAAGSMSSRMTRSSQNAQNVEVHQTLPPLPAPVPSVPSADYEADVVISKTTGRQIVTRKHKERRPADVKIVEVGRPEDTQEPPKKRRSQGPAVVHQVQQEASFTSDFGSVSNVMIYDEEAQEGALRPPPTTHYHRPLGPRNPAAASRGSSNSRRAPRKPVLSSATPVVSAASPASSAVGEQAPISFHYPQRVRVRRPMQAQIVEVKASPAANGRKRSSAPVVNNGHSLPLRDQRDSSHQSKPVTRASRAKNLLFSGEDAENEIPVWED
ncbi:hypothetical protein F503_04386 [Ophiostoma piceae UAMH 11346]|uniref:Uncharacterized protein n=1 Tax=Ophiostoma piceae (strain UAMH 11346) TaxID=1262450 RepID=S3C5L5_OPHP1|nr:hypothetical protein F503_04386 [Ophiostoma piceae UAMH 11346]